jgi:hypothetical protein
LPGRGEESRPRRDREDHRHLKNNPKDICERFPSHGLPSQRQSDVTLLGSNEEAKEVL